MRWWPRQRARKLAEQQSLRTVFFASSMAFVLVTGWAIWNEEATRRPWKEYQLEFNRLEYQRVSEALGAEKANFNSPQVQAAVARVEADLKAARGLLAGPEYARAQKTLAERQVDHADLNMKAQFIKSELDEALYWVEHAIYEKKDTKAPKAKVALIEKQYVEISPKVEAQSARVDEAQRELKRFRGDVDKLEAKLEELSAPVTGLE
ncbi:MAG: hypothetical protein L0191_09415, partial [Acidobacteria bacterium]|nr:hypothetical protein [Acidobacteriota bacterium]